jgi:SAM-dependent methyltransferase
MTDSDPIRAYWDDQARRFQGNPRATTQDYWMREVEVAAVNHVLSRMDACSRVLDIGCGNGYSTIRLAQTHPSMFFVGGDFSSEMITAAILARDSADPALADRLTFEVLDVTDLPSRLRLFDVVVSDRCLINLPTAEAQWTALESIADRLQRGGLYVAAENFLDGQANLNAARADQGLPPIAIRWHNRFFDPEELLQHADPWFELLRTDPISSTYYLATRVIYSKLCQLEGREPDYDHPIYEVATRLPIGGNFGPIKLLEFRRR